MGDRTRSLAAGVADLYWNLGRAAHMRTPLTLVSLALAFSAHACAAAPPRADAALVAFDRATNTLAAGQPKAAISGFVSAYSLSRGDLDLTVAERTAIERQYVWALLQEPEKRRPELLAYAEAVLLDQTASPERIDLGLAAAGQLLHRDLRPPAKHVDAFVASVAAEITSPIMPWNPERQGAYIMSMMVDRSGRIWVGTEDNGLWMYDKAAADWRQFTSKDGLGDDDVYALAQDRLGRIWAGNLNHGVSVYNGKSWRSYGPLDGPLGCRVFAIATSPTDGDVWMATEWGLCRYSLSKDTWSYYTRLQGLPSDQATSLAFDKRGTLYVGTDCDGIAVGTARDGYRRWRRVTGLDQIPNAPAGAGIPSNQINCLLADSHGTIWAGTPCGLAHSSDSGVTWRFKRGPEWADRVRGLWNAPKVSDGSADDLLLEDYVSTLAEDANGLVYIGYRKENFEVRNPVTGERVYPLDSDVVPTLYLSSLVALPDGYVLLGRYGDGVRQNLPFAQSAGHRQRPPVDVPQVVTTGTPPLPTPAKPLHRADQVEALTKSLDLSAPSLKPGQAYYLGEDWQTAGDWEGRYGKQLAVLCGAQAPIDHTIWGDFTYDVKGDIGPHHKGGDGLRHWIHWLTTDNPKCLWDPAVGHRRQAEWDDHGEDYDPSFEGPDVVAAVKVPAGVHRLSLYFMNKDGHDGSNRYRNYMIEVRADMGGLRYAINAPVLAHARVQNFWGGVYHEFVLRGPATFDVRVAKNDSLNAIVSAVLLDRLAGPVDKMKVVRDPWLSAVPYEPAPAPTEAQIDQESSPKLLRASIGLWNALDSAWDRPALAPLQYAYRLQAYRAISAKRMSPPLLEDWRWALHLWTNDDRSKFDQIVNAQWASVLASNPDIKHVKDR
jgi:hypothetical protein